MDDENYRKIKMMVENAVGATWVGAQERAFGRLMTAAVISWIWFLGGVVYDAPPRTTSLGLLFSVSALALWQFTNYRDAERGFNISESARSVPDRVFIASTAERIGAEAENADS